MLKSMTGFGSHSESLNDCTITSEVKTLNSKYLDLSLKIPRVLYPKELDIRNLISQKLTRGKVSFSLQIEGLSNNTKTISINEELFNEYLKKYKELEIAAGREFNDILKLVLDSPDVQNIQEDELDDDFWNIIKQNIENTLHKCAGAREKEGQELKSVLISYVKKIQSSLNSIKTLEPDRLKHLKAKIQSSLNDLISSGEYDKDRLEQELIYYSEKLDINEEIERLNIHCNSYLETLEADKDQHGKRLGFISQEMGREINTIGSKANNSDIQQYVILMKEELEKIKEQSLNIL